MLYLYFTLLLISLIIYDYNYYLIKSFKLYNVESLYQQVYIIKLNILFKDIIIKFLKSFV